MFSPFGYTMPQRRRQRPASSYHPSHYAADPYSGYGDPYAAEMERERLMARRERERRMQLEAQQERRAREQALMQQERQRRAHMAARQRQMEREEAESEGESEPVSYDFWGRPIRRRPTRATRPSSSYRPTPSESESVTSEASESDEGTTIPILSSHPATRTPSPAPSPASSRTVQRPKAPAPKAPTSRPASRLDFPAPAYTFTPPKVEPSPPRRVSLRPVQPPSALPSLAFTLADPSAWVYTASLPLEDTPL
ncbi:hypothetical protein KIPB_012845, partial [Kipferlia bialata]|eukprot:g12845.t1